MDKIKEISEKWKQDMEALRSLEDIMIERIMATDDEVLQDTFLEWQSQRLKCNETYSEYVGLLGEIGKRES